MIPDDMFARLYGMGFGLGRSSPVGKAWQERVRQVLSSGAPSSVASPVKQMPKERKFWMWVNCELIVYGGTEPDAKVTVQGKPVSLIFHISAGYIFTPKIPTFACLFDRLSISPHFFRGKIRCSLDGYGHSFKMPSFFSESKKCNEIPSGRIC